ncbi:MAG: hypothetical protein JO218_15410, partial [Burkholderiales bacterium]|nr:hypothetical protein [Burkholderiales bacterium]
KGDESGKLKERVHSLEEDTAAKQKALTDANERVAQLEQANKKLEELLAVKSKQGSDIQKDAAAKGKPAATPAAATPTPTPAATKPAATPAPTPTPATTPAATATPAPAAKQEAAKPTVTPAAVPATAGNENAAPKPAEAEKPKKAKKPVPPPPPEPESSIFDNLPLLGGAALALIAVVGGGFWFIRKRRKSSFEDSIITGSDLKSNTMVGNTGGAVISTGVTENSFLTDFSRAGLGTIDTDEVDPIAEAEVYMAYGRDAQAEEILRDALVRDGSRQEVRLKLLEIYNARKNTAAFEATAQELYSATQGHGPAWAQAAAMGKALDPQNPLYQQQEPVDTGALDQTMVMSAGTLGEMTDTAKLHAPLVEDAHSEAAHVGAGSDLDFQLDAAPTAEAAPAAPSELDFDLGFDVPQVGGTAAAAPEAHPVHEVEEHHAAMPEFDLGAADVAAAEPAHAASSDLDLDLGFGTEVKPEQPPVAASASDDILSLDIPLDLGAESVHAEPAHVEPALTAPAAPHVDDHAASFELPPMGSDFDLDLDAAPEHAHAAAVAHSPNTGMAELDSPDLAGDLDFNFDMNEGHKKAEPAAPEFDIGNVSLDLDAAPGPAAAGDVMDFGVEMDDPVTTKIDLARAYIDMGDKEGAREILQEAVNEGNADQKASAETLLAQL